MESSVESTRANSEGVVGIEDDPGYRSLNVLALVSLVLGIAAPLCLAAPLLLVIPLLGIALASVALGQIASSDGATAGRWAAVVGLALCVGAIGATFSRSLVKEELLSRQAREVAMRWLSLLQAGDAEKAYNMTSASRRPKAPPHPDEPQSGHALPDPVEEFRQRPVVDYMLAHGAHCQFRYESDVEPGVGSPKQYFLRQRFAVRDEAHGGDPIELVIGLQRSRMNNKLEWTVTDAESEQLKAPVQDHDHSHSHAHPHSHDH